MTNSNECSLYVFLRPAFFAIHQRPLFAVLSMLFVAFGFQNDVTNAALVDGCDCFFSGKVVDENGEPLPDSTVAVIATNPNKWASRVVGNTSSSCASEILIEKAVDSDGGFNFWLPEFPETSHESPWLIWRAPGKGVGFRKIDLDWPNIGLELKLRPEQIIRGKMTGGDGHETKFLVTSVAKSELRTLKSGCSNNCEKECRAWIGPITTTKDGAFEIPGVPAGHGVSLSILGNDVVSPQAVSINLNRGSLGTVPERRRFETRKGAPLDDPLVIPLYPKRIIRGKVTAADTGKPLQGALVSAHKYHPARAYAGVSCKTDENGAYELNVECPNETRVPDGTRVIVVPPVMPRDVIPFTSFKLGKRVFWSSETNSQTVDFELSRLRVVFVKGAVTEKDTGKPIEGVTVKYRFDYNRNKKFTSARGRNVGRPRPEDTQTDTNGIFSIAVPPGPGRLLFHAGPQSNYVLKNTNSSKLTGRRATIRTPIIRHHEIVEINPKESDKVTKLAPVQLNSGKRLTCKVLDADGKPVPRFKVLTLLNISRTGKWTPSLSPFIGSNGSFELKGLEDSKKYRVHVFSSATKQGATLVVSAGQQPTFKLQPYGTVSATLLDAEGKPVKFVSTLYLGIGEKEPLDHWGVVDKVLLRHVDPINAQSIFLADDSGKLEMTGLIPGATYQVVFGASGTTSSEFFVAPSGTKDLGEIRLLENPKKAEAKEKAKAKATRPQTDRREKKRNTKTPDY